MWANAMVIPHHARFLATESPRTIVFIYLFEIPIYLLILWFGLVNWGIAGAALAWSIRVILDTGLILSLNRVLVQTVRACTASMMLVLCAIVIALFTDASDIKLLSLCLLTATSLAKDRQTLVRMYHSILGRPSGIS